MKKFLVSLLALMMLVSSAFALELPEPGVLPLVTEPVTLTIMMCENTLTTDYQDNYFNKYLKEMTGVDIKVELLPADAAEAKQKLSLMIAGGQKLPDILILGLNEAERYSYGSSGYFVALNEYIENDAYFWKQNMEQYASPAEVENVLKYAKSADGNIYAYPAYYVDPGDASALGMWINKKWLDNLGLEVPTTTEEFYQCLKAFKENDCNGNGDPNDEIPYVGHNGWMGSVTSYLLNSFEYYAWHGDQGYQLNAGEDGKLYAPFATEEFREGLKYLAKLYAEGLISPLSFSQTQNELRSIMCAPNADPTLVGAFTGHPSPLFGSDGSVDRVTEYVACPAMIGPEGVNWTPNAGWKGTYCTFITADCEYPELAYRVLDAVAQPEASLTMRYGEQGVDWIFTTEGEIRYKTLEGYGPIYTQISTPSIWTSENAKIWHANSFNMLPPKLMAGTTGEPRTGNRGYQMDTLWCWALPLRFDNHPDELVLSLIYTPEELDQIAEIQATLRTFVGEAVANFTIGNRNIETEWETYLSELEAIGLAQYLEVSQTAYERMK